MDSRFVWCVEKRKLVRIGVQADLIKKELDAAASDLERAERTLKDNDPKWATVQGYYSMFHSAKALVLSKGYREKSHMCLAVALQVLFAEEGLLERRYYENFKKCMELRIDADYGLMSSKIAAEEIMSWAKDFLEVTKKTIANLKVQTP